MNLMAAGIGRIKIIGTDQNVMKSTCQMLHVLVIAYMYLSLLALCLNCLCLSLICIPYMYSMVAIVYIHTGMLYFASQFSYAF